MDGKSKPYFGDNLLIPRYHVADARAGLIYLDPPFNSSANFNVLFKEKSREESAGQIIVLCPKSRLAAGIEKSHDIVQG
jgi:hypothetical protein